MAEIPESNRRTFLKATGAAGATAAMTGTAMADEETTEFNALNLIRRTTASMAIAEAEVNEATPASASIAATDDALGLLNVEVPADAAEAIKSELEDNANFSTVEYDTEHEAFDTPNDELFNDQYAPQQVRAPTAYDTTQGSDDVTIAIVDQGVMYDHPDLESRFGSTKGYDFVDDDDDPYPDSMSNEYHGTHVAGSASATTDNSEGIAGISDSTLLSVRVLSEQGSGSTADIAQGIRWATDQGADIINMSLGGGGYTDTMKNAVSYAVSNGCLPICAAGNNGSSSVSYPAAYSECVAVSAVDENENLASFSQYGENLDVASPGVDVLSCWTESTSYGQYNKISGTSMACPNAAGVAALGLAAHPDLGPNELRNKLKNTAVDIGLDDLEQGAGRVDAANIVEGSDPNEGPNAAFNVNPSAPTVGSDATFDASGSSDPDGSITSFDWDLGDGTQTSGETVTHAYSSAGDYQVTLTVTDDGGKTDSATQTVTVQSDEPDNEVPTASFSVSPTDPMVGDTVSVDASASSDPDGSIASFEWDFGDGASATGETASHAYDTAGDYTITLTVTDDDGASDTASQAITVRSEGGSCGDQTATSSADGYLRGWYDDANYTFTPDLDNPCQVTVNLDGPRRADFDLYVTFDGREPSTWDYDARSISYGPDEQIVVDDIDADQQLGILVDSYRGRGNFTISADELGK